MNLKKRLIGITSLMSGYKNDSSILNVGLGAAINQESQYYKPGSYKNIIKHIID